MSVIVNDFEVVTEGAPLPTDDGHGEDSEVQPIAPRPGALLRELARLHARHDRLSAD